MMTKKNNLKNTYQSPTYQNFKCKMNILNYLERLKMYNRERIRLTSNFSFEIQDRDSPGGPVAKNPPAKTGHVGLIPGPRRSHMLWGKKPVRCNHWSLFHLNEIK